MSKTENQLREEIVRVGRLVFEKGWVAANDGNITVRLSDGHLLSTPTGVCKGMMKPEDLIVCDLDGGKIHGERERTTEMAMHLTVYRMRPDIHSVVHAHPPVATGFACAGRALNIGLLPEVVISLGSVPLADYGLPGTPALTAGMLPYIAKYDALLMANHGAVSYGEDLWQAYFRMEMVEHYARILLVAELLGGARALPRVEVEKLFESRTRYRVKSRNHFEPGAPMTAEDLPEPGEKIEMTREQLVAIIDEALKVRGLV
ncbi:MAG TPA: class II aldolase/adducin family protein [Bryobacteraceae bacterium]|jgi:L-fuculose-phosphate aldolase|nr:class II aldolase/adducin family protein [Bryobacteraceae bacterium]